MANSLSFTRGRAYGQEPAAKGLHIAEATDADLATRMMESRGQLFWASPARWLMLDAAQAKRGELSDECVRNMRDGLMRCLWWRRPQPFPSPRRRKAELRPLLSNAGPELCVGQSNLFSTNLEGILLRSKGGVPEPFVEVFAEALGQASRRAPSYLRGRASGFVGALLHSELLRINALGLERHVMFARTERSPVSGRRTRKQRAANPFRSRLGPETTSRRRQPGEWLAHVVYSRS